MRVGIGLEKIRAYLEENKDRHIQRIQSFVQQPSVSTENNGVRECAELLVQIHKEMGCTEAKLVGDPDIPGVWAYYDAGAEDTIVVYGNFDTRPVAPHEQWDNSPWSGALTSMGPYSRVLVGRGAPSKGSYIAWLNALEAMNAVEGKVPFNVRFLIEGDEILGSPTWPQMYEEYRPRLATAKASFSPGASQDGQGRALMSLGFKGMIYADLICSGEKWGRGPQGAPAHGMTKSVVDSPSWRLVQALATLTGKNGNDITIKGFYDDLTPPDEDEKKAAFDFRSAMGGGSWNQVLPGVAAIKTPAGDLGEDETVLNYFYGPSFNINSLRAGLMGAGTMPFTLPNTAAARFDLRVPRGFSVDKVVKQIRDHLEAEGFGDIELDVLAANDSSQTGTETELVQAVVEAFEEMEVPLIIAPYSGGGGPWSLYKNDLGLPMIRSVGVGGGGVGPSGDEYFVIDGSDVVGGLIECELSPLHMLKAYAKKALS